MEVDFVLFCSLFLCSICNNSVLSYVIQFSKQRFIIIISINVTETLENYSMILQEKKLFAKSVELYIFLCHKSDVQLFRLSVRAKHFMELFVVGWDDYSVPLYIKLNENNNKLYKTSTGLPAKKKRHFKML